MKFLEKVFKAPLVIVYCSYVGLLLFKTWMFDEQLIAMLKEHFKVLKKVHKGDAIMLVCDTEKLTEEEKASLILKLKLQEELSKSIE